MEGEMKLFTREELKSRSTRADAVLIIHNEVYDVTKFLLEVNLITTLHQVILVYLLNIVPNLK